MSKVLKGILIGVLALALFVGGYFLATNNTKKADLSAKDYLPDDAQIAEIRKRVWSFDPSTQTSLTQSFEGGPSVVTFVGGTFPLTKIVEKRTGKNTPVKFDASLRSANRDLIQNLIDKYGTFVKQASERFSIPQLYIYIVMAVENTEGKSNYVSPGGFVGLMQINTSSAADTLVTQKRRKLLTLSDLSFFQKKFSSSVFSLSNQVSNTNLKDAEANINAGALHLSEQIVNNKFEVVKDIHKIFFSYNRGKNRLTNDSTTNLSIDSLINHYIGGVHKVGAEYVIRALGPHGAADILVNDLKITT